MNVVAEEEEEEEQNVREGSPAPAKPRPLSNGNGAAEQQFRDVTEMTVEELKVEMEDVQTRITKLEEEIKQLEVKEAANEEEDEYELEVFDIPPHCVPIRCDVRLFDWDALAKKVQFDVIVMDPPWQLAGSAPTRGVALGYKQLHNKDIASIPIPKLQSNGFLFIWVINARYSFALDLMEKWGYRLVDDLTWVKATVNRRLAKGHGFYLQHAKETCLIGLKGEDPPGMRGNLESDVIFSERRGQSQKPEELYTRIESLVPNGKYLEIFARRNNLRNYWVSVGLEL
ncbi:MT-A70-domain-containing protein [Balamuthia mandrillaris]